MIKHFCDRCQLELVTEDFNPFIRLDRTNGIFVSALAVNGQSKPISDLCRSCIVIILADGEHVTSILPVLRTVEPTQTQVTPLPVPLSNTIAVAPLQSSTPANTFDAVKPAILPAFEPSMQLPPTAQ